MIFNLTGYQFCTPFLKIQYFINVFNTFIKYKELKMKEVIEQDFIFNQERRTATQAFRYVGLSPPVNMSRLNIKNIHPPYLVQQLKFDILNIQINQQDGYEYSRAGRRIDARHILDVLKKI